MPSFTVCTSCGKRLRLRPDTAPVGPLCHDCRRKICLQCGQVNKRRESRFCCDDCRKAYRLAGVTA